MNRIHRYLDTRYLTITMFSGYVWNVKALSRRAVAINLGRWCIVIG